MCVNDNLISDFPVLFQFEARRKQIAKDKYRDTELPVRAQNVEKTRRPPKEVPCRGQIDIPLRKR